MAQRPVTHSSTPITSITYPCFAPAKAYICRAVGNRCSLFQRWPGPGMSPILCILCPGF